MDDRPRIVVTRALPTAVEARLTAAFDVQLNVDDRPLGRDGVVDALRTADGLLTTVTDRLDADVIATACRARIIANFGVGFEHIDLEAADHLGIVVTNTPGVLTDDTADLAMALILMAARRAGEGERELRSGAWTGWRPTHLLGRRLGGATLGIVGMGRIGQAVARRARDGFGMRVRYFQPRPVAVEPALAEPCGSLDELLAVSDVVSLHCPASSETRKLIKEDTIRRMRTGAILVNTARGSVVDEVALADALRSGKLRAAGLDVYDDEPHVHPALLGLDNAVLLPHLGSATEATRVAMGMCAVDNLEAFFGGGTAPNRVYLPGA